MIFDLLRTDESMCGALVCHGNILIADRAETACHGDVVVMGEQLHA